MNLSSNSIISKDNSSVKHNFLMGVCGSHTKRQKFVIIDKHVPKQVELCDPRCNRLYKNHKLMSMTMMSLESCVCEEYDNIQGQNIMNTPDELLNQHKGMNLIL